MTQAASAGDINYTIRTFDASTNFVITDVVSGITTSMSENDIARQVQTQVYNTVLSIGASYNGVPVNVGTTPPAQFQLTRSDHVVCLFSQSQFELIIDSDTTGASLSIRSNPTLITVSDAQAWGAVMSQTYSGLSTSQIIKLLEIVSDDIINVCRTNFVLSTYVLNFYTELWNGYQLPNYPVYDLDDPTIDRPYTLLNFTDVTVSDSTTRYIIEKNGWITYKYPQNLVEVTNDPFAFGNNWRASWIAGHFRIPDQVKTALVKLTPFYTNFSIYEELAGGTSRVKFKDETTEKNKIMMSLQNLML